MFQRGRQLQFLILLVGFILNPELFAQVSRNFNKKAKPHYELGAGFIYLKVYNYPGSTNFTYRSIPFPFAIYRGKKLRADEDGTRARILHNDFVELGFSAGFNFPIKASQNPIRKGMPDKGALLGIGPGLLFKLYRDSRQKLTAGIGLRANLETGKNFSLKQQGWIIEPNIRYWFKPFADSIVTVFTGVSFSAADKNYNSFFYSVDREYVRSNRSEFNAQAGLVDMAYSLGVTFDISQKSSVFVGGVYSNLSTAANKESALLENEHNYSFAIGFVWLFSESKRLVN